MRSILYRYVLKEQLVPLCVCTMGLTVILITGRLMQLARYLFTSSLTVYDLVMLIALALPKTILYVLPMATLIGVLLAFARLSSDNEIIAMRAAGVSFRQFLPPVLTVLLATTTLSFYICLTVMPNANEGFRSKVRELGHASIPALLRSGTFIDMIPKLVFFFQNVDVSNLHIDGVFIQDDRQADVRATIIAEGAKIIYQENRNEVMFNIRNGVITRVGKNLKDNQVVEFKAYDLKVDFDELVENAPKATKQKSEMNVSELRRVVAGKDPTYLNRFLLELHQRFALPVGCLVLGLVGAPLGAFFRHGNRMTGVTIGLGVFLLYYVILSAGKGAGENGIIPPSLAAWTPNLLALSLAIYLWTKIQRETPFRLARYLGYLQPIWEAVQRKASRSAVPVGQMTRSNPRE